VPKPHLPEPFPHIASVWTDPITGFKVPKVPLKNLQWREKLLKEAESDKGLQGELISACSESISYWVNAFVWTYHQFDVNVDGTRRMADHADVPFITWEVQDDLFNQFVTNLFGEDVKDRDILVNKSRDMGASWCCTAFLHWLWLFRPDKQMLQLSRTEPYVDQTGNMKALFQKNDYINLWLPDWMRPPDCLPGGKNRTKMHMSNVWNGSVIDGESTTKHAASGDRRLVILLDEFAKVEHGGEMRSATRDAGLMRIVNSTVAGPGTEYSKWKNSGQIKVFSLMWWEHPDKGKGRYTVQDATTGMWKIRSPWYDSEEAVRSPKEMAREVDAEDNEAGEMFFSPGSIDKHIALFAAKPKSHMVIDFKFGVANDHMPDIIRRRKLESVLVRKNSKGPLRLWANLINGRLDQTKSYIIGIDLSKGQSASNTVFSVKCRETKVKVAEWADARTPPYEAARIAVALAIWIGGRTGLPYLKWENNGPGWDFGRYMVIKWAYPFYYRSKRPGSVREKKTKNYGWNSGRREKEELLREYDRVLAHGGYINPSKEALEEARQYIDFPDGSIGPACLVEENSAARKTHGDRVIADALTIEDADGPKGGGKINTVYPHKTAAWRKKQLMDGRKSKHKWNKAFNFGS